nr:hypothetical protein [Angustibacter aerolatus]
MSMLITSMIMALTGTVVVTTLRQQQTAVAKTNASASLRITMEALTRDLRVASPPDAVTNAITSAGPREIIFFSARGAYNETTKVMPAPTKVRYWIDPTGGCLRRTMVAAGGTPAAPTYPSDTSVRAMAGTCLSPGRYNPTTSTLFAYCGVTSGTDPCLKADGVTSTVVVPSTAEAGALGSVLSATQENQVADVRIAMQVQDAANTRVGAATTTRDVVLINRATALQGQG